MPGNASPVDSPTAPGPIKAGDQGFGDLATAEGRNRTTSAEQARAAAPNTTPSANLTMAEISSRAYKKRGVMVRGDGFRLSLAHGHTGSAHFGQQRRPMVMPISKATSARSMVSWLTRLRARLSPDKRVPRAKEARNASRDSKRRARSTVPLAGGSKDSGHLA